MPAQGAGDRLTSTTVRVVSRSAKPDWPKKGANSHAKMPQPPSRGRPSSPSCFCPPSAGPARTKPPSYRNSPPVSSTHHDLWIPIAWATDGETVTSGSAVLLQLVSQVLSSTASPSPANPATRPVACYSTRSPDLIAPALILRTWISSIRRRRCKLAHGRDAHRD